MVAGEEPDCHQADGTGDCHDRVTCVVGVEVLSEDDLQTCRCAADSWDRWRCIQQSACSTC